MGQTTDTALGGARSDTALGGARSDTALGGARSEVRSGGGGHLTVTPAPAGPPERTEVLDDLLVEEVSIDGMCGVY